MAMCFVPGCKHYTEQRRCRFYRFPIGDQPRKLWIKLIRRDKPSKSSYVCSCHFVDGNKKNYPTLFEQGPRKKLRSLSPVEIAERKDRQVSGVNEPSTSQDMTWEVESNIVKNGLIETIKTEIVYEESEIIFEEISCNSDLHHSIVIKTEQEDVLGEPKDLFITEEQHHVDKESHSTKLPEQVNLTQPSTKDIVDKSCKSGYASREKSYFQKHLQLHAESGPDNLLVAIGDKNAESDVILQQLRECTHISERELVEDKKRKLKERFNRLLQNIQSPTKLGVVAKMLDGLSFTLAAMDNSKRENFPTTATNVPHNKKRRSTKKNDKAY